MNIEVMYVKPSNEPGIDEAKSGQTSVYQSSCDVKVPQVELRDISLLSSLQRC